MRRTFPFVVLWFAAGALAAAVATAGVAVVNDQLTSPRPPPLSAAEVREALDAPTTSTTLAPEDTTSTTTKAATTTTTADGGVSDGGAGGGTTDGTPAVSPTTTTTRPAPAPAPVTRTYDLEGGTATLRFSVSGVTVLSASPAPGFTVDVNDSHSGGKRVEFESDAHRSRVDAWWDGGPRDEVREDD